MDGRDESISKVQMKVSHRRMPGIGSRTRGRKRLPTWMGSFIVIACALAVPLGYVMLRLRGPFFAMGMFGMAQMVRVVVTAIPATGSGSGLLTVGVKCMAISYLKPSSNRTETYIRLNQRSICRLTPAVCRQLKMRCVMSTGYEPRIFSRSAALARWRCVFHTH